MDLLKLIALDAEDLGVISAHVQDAILRSQDMTWLPREGRFVAMLSRFDWTQALGNGGRDLARRQAALRFDRVAKVRSVGIVRAGQASGGAGEVAPYVLLAIAFARRTEDDPAGTVTLTFAGSATIELEVECLEAELRDLGPAWTARARPHHPADDDQGPGGAS